MWWPFCGQGPGSILTLAAFNFVVAAHVEETFTGAGAPSRNQVGHGVRAEESDGPLSFLTMWLLRRLQAAEAEDVPPAVEAMDTLPAAEENRMSASRSQTKPQQLQDADAAGIPGEASVAPDYDFINSFLREQVFVLGDQGPYSSGVGQSVLIRNLTCTKISMKDIKLTSPSVENKAEVHVDLVVSQLFLRCHAGLEITTFGLKKHGSFKAISGHESSVGARLTLHTSEGEDFTRDPPTSVTISNCDDRTAFFFNDVEIYNFLYGATTALGALLGNRLASGFKNKLCVETLPTLQAEILDMLRRPLFQMKFPEYSSMQQDDDAAEQLATSHHTHALDLPNDGLIGLAVQGLHALPVGRIMRNAIVHRVPNPLILAGEDTLWNISRQGMQASLALKTIALLGIDSLRDVTFFKRTSDSSGTHSISWEQLELQVEVAVTVSGHGRNVVFPANVTLDVRGVTIDLQTMLALDKHVWQTTALGSIWHSMKSGMPAACWVKAILAAELSHLNITFDSVITSVVNAPVGRSGLPSGLGYALQQVSSIGIELFGGFLEDRLAPFTCQTSVRKVVNSRLTSFLQGFQGQECPPFHYKSAPAMNYSRRPFSDLSRSINEILHSNSKAQQLAKDLTKKHYYGPGQVELIGNDGLQFDGQLERRLPYAYCHLHASNVSIVNLDTLYDVFLLDPQGAYSLHNSAAGHQLGIKGHIIASMYSKNIDPETGDLKASKELKVDAVISLGVTDVMLILDLFMPIDMNKLLNITLSRVSVPCFMGAFEDWAIRLFNFSISGIDLDIQCKNQKGSCSKEVLDIAHRAHNRTVISQATEQFNSFVRQKTKLFESVTASTNLYKVLQRSHNLCWNLPDDPSLAWTDPSKEANATRSLQSFLILFVGWVFPMLWIGMLGGLVMAFMWLHRNINISQEIVRQVSDGSTGSTTVSAHTRMKQAWRNVRGSSAPFLCACVFNIALFLLAHFHVGAQVDISLTFLGFEVTYPSWRTFNCIQTVRLLWSSQGYMLSVLIALFSILWPYVKLLSLIAMILLPPETQNYHRRGRLLYIMDRLGKYSMLDVYFIILVFAFLEVEAGTQRNSVLLGPDFLLINIRVSPSLGLFALILGVIMSICLNQIALAMHRHTVEAKEGKMPGELVGGKKEALCNHTWLVDMGMPFHQQMRPCGIVCTALAMVFCIILISVGWYIHIFNTEIHGLAGFLSELRGDPTSMKASLASMAKSILKQCTVGCTWSYWLGDNLIMVCQILFAGLFPLLQVVCMLVLWLKPMTIRSHRRMNSIIQAVSAVASLEVFLLSSCVGYVEITHVSETFGHAYTKIPSIHRVLEMATEWGIINRAEFLSLEFEFKWGFHVLAWGATLYCMLSSKMIEWSTNAERERLIEYRRHHGVTNYKDSGLSLSHSNSVNLESEFVAKIQYVSAWMRLMTITDQNQEEARDQFWERCHRGGLQSAEAPGKSLAKSATAGSTSLTELLLRR